MTIEIQSSVAAIAKPSDVGGEPEMEAYAAQRMGLETKELKNAEATTTEANAASTDSEKTAADATQAEDRGSKNISESATDEDVISKLEEEHPAKKDIKESFSKMSAKQKEMQARADAEKAAAEQARKELIEAKAEVERLRQEAADFAKASIPVVKSAEDDPIPSRLEFDDPDEYVAALSAHAARSAIREANQAALQVAKFREEEAKKASEAARQEQEKAKIVDLHKTFNDRLNKVKSEIPDFEEKVMSDTSPQLDVNVFFEVEQSEMGPQILYHLASNPAEAENLNKLNRINPRLSLIRLGEIQAEIRIANKPIRTKAAAPVTPIGSRSNPERKTPDEMSMDEYAEMHNKKHTPKQAQRARR